MTPSCLTCSHGALRDKGNEERDKLLRRMAKLGFINCTDSDFSATFHAHAHTCRAHSPTDEQTTAARRAWAADLHQKRT